MRSSFILFERRATRAAALSLLGTALVAACDNTQPLEPSRSMPASSPVAIRTGNSGAVALQVVTGKNALLGGSTFQLWNSMDKYVVTDNGNGDSDAVDGKITLASVTPGVYDLCEIKPPAGYSISGSAKCHPVAVNAGATANGGTFPNVHLPTVTTGYADSLRAPIGGGTFTAKDSVSNTLMTIVDNGAFDNDKTDGKFSFNLPSAGTFVICETTPPPGYAFPAGQSTYCYVVKVANDVVTAMGTFRVNTL